MNGIREEQPNSEQEPTSEMEQPQAEMPEDFVEPKGKSKGWGEPVEAEIEVEGKKEKVRYREKVIELPKHRQQETGIKRIRRRELLPPFPEGFYIPLTDRMENARERLAYHFPTMDQKRAEDHVKKNTFPVYSADDKFDDIYKFLTNGRYPSEETLAHVMNYRLNDPTLVMQKEFKEVDRFKKEGLYFQKILEERKGVLFFRRGRAIIDYGTPLFVFGTRNKNFLEYINFLGMDSNISYYDRSLTIPIKEREEPLRWCHAELALVPTKRSLNVLFFETGDEGNKEDKNNNESTN